MKLASSSSASVSVEVETISTFTVAAIMRRLRRVDPRVGGQPLADIFRLADIEHVICRVQHSVDAGRGRRETDRVFDRGMADRERAFGDRSRRLFENLGQPRLLILL